jgi:hypothetical protein
MHSFVEFCVGYSILSCIQERLQGPEEGVDEYINCEILSCTLSINFIWCSIDLHFGGIDPCGLHLVDLKAKVKVESGLEILLLLVGKC